MLAMIEYSLDLDIPDHVFENPIVRAMSDATTDIMTWPNVSNLIRAFEWTLISFELRISVHST